jgi:hypothetical protein
LKKYFEKKNLEIGVKHQKPIGNFYLYLLSLLIPSKLKEKDK